MLWIIKKKIADKWFWFIEASNWEEIFFHAKEMSGEYWAFENTPEWTEVEFEIENWNDGRSFASNVRAVDWMTA